MGIFKGRYLYKEPERLSAEEARERRLQSALARSRVGLEERTAPLSPANSFHLKRLKEFELEFGAEIEARRARVAALARARQRDPSIQRSRTLRTAMSRLFQLQQRRSALLQRAAAERRARVYKSVASAIDSRVFSFSSFGPQTIFNTDAWTKLMPGEVTRRMFRSPLLIVPCIQRAVRREVLFAKKQGGRGHKGPRRRGPWSNIGC